MGDNERIRVSPDDVFLRRSDHAIVTIGNVKVSRDGSEFLLESHRAGGYTSEWIDDIHDRIESRSLIPIEEIDDYLKERSLT